jgi:hypothetical protein
VYASGGTIYYVNSAFTTSGTFATVPGAFFDQIAFDPTGNYLFGSDLNGYMDVIGRDGTLIQKIFVMTPAVDTGSGTIPAGHHAPDGIAFHADSPKFVVTNDTDGTMTRFDFPNDDYTKAPTQTLFASGGFYGDHAAVGPDGYLYASQEGTHYADGTTVTNQESIVRIGPGFAPPAGVGAAVNAVEGQDSGLQTLATIAPRFGDTNASHYTADIDWGDGKGVQLNSGTITYDASAGALKLKGSHTYGEESDPGHPFQISITVHHTGTADVAVQSAATVSDPAVQAKGGPIGAVEGTAFSGAVATFTDPAGAELDAQGNPAPGEYSALITWGDLDAQGNPITSQGTVGWDPAQNLFVVNGSHTYGEEGLVNVTVAISHGTAPVTTTPGSAATVVDTPAVSVTDAGGTYNGQPSPATAATVTDPGDGPIASFGDPLLSYTYYLVNGDGSLGASLGGSAPVNAGRYAVVAHYAGGGFFTAADSPPTAFTIQQATPAVSVSDAGGTYNGLPYPATAASVSGVGGDGTIASFGDASLSYTYYQNGSPLPGAPVNAGTYTVVAHYAGSANYLPADSDPAPFTIARATPLVSVTGGAFVYDGQAHDATGSVTGVTGENLGTPAFSYTDAGGHAVAHPVAAGTYTVTASYAGSANYAPASATATLTIDRATPAFSGLTTTTTYGSASTTVSGKLTLGGLVPTGYVSIAVAGVTTNPVQARVGPDGNFSVTVPTAALRPGSYAVNYRYGGDANFAPAAADGTLQVSYGVRVLFPKNFAMPGGAVLPVVVQLTTAGGANVSSANVPVTAVFLVAADGTTRPIRVPGRLNPSRFFSLSSYGYLFLLDLSGLTPGSYTLYVTAGNDPVLHPITFQVR